jgi:RNA polymerase sigma factor (sigma-70 family)
MRVHKSIHTYNPNKKALPWLFTIARNVIIDIHSLRFKQYEVLVEELPEKHEESIENDAMETIHNILEHLDSSDRDLILRRFINEESYENMASELNMKPEALRQRLSRSLRKIREIFNHS